MTHIIRVRNVNHALGEGFAWLKVAGILEDSRNGPVSVAPGPVITEYTHPTERVLFNADRDANPVFHLLEAIWMFAGRNDSAWLLPYNARMKEYAEDNGSIHGAYGYRWRQFFGFDQIRALVKELRTNRNSRRAVMSMWSPAADLGVDKRDLPCNTHIYFDLRGGRLNMTVCCRSNDILWGAYGANAVHFSMLQELVAFAVEAPVGVYRQMSNNYHAYTSVPTVAKFLDMPPVFDQPYPAPVVPLLQNDETYQSFIEDCVTLLEEGETSVFHTSFFRRVVAPLKRAYDMRKAGARTWKVSLDGAAVCDWRQSFIEWAERRDHVG